MTAICIKLAIFDFGRSEIASKLIVEKAKNQVFSETVDARNASAPAPHS
jgi:hypothetical protein